MRGRYAIVLTHNRPAELDRCLEAIVPQVDDVLVIDNASVPRAFPTSGYVDDHVWNIYEEEQPPNLSRLWNVGFQYFDDHTLGKSAHFEYDVAVLCDDAYVHSTWFDDVSSAMRSCGAAAASTHGITPITHNIIKYGPDNDIMNRLCSWAFIVRGEAGLRADERLRWWWGDTDFDWRARAAGGMLLVQGPVVLNERPNDFTYSKPGLAEQAGRDAAMFTEIHGWRPW